MSTENRAFRGVWIPAELWLNPDLSVQEKVMLVEIDSLQDPKRGCFKSNKKLAEFFHLSPSRVSEIIGGLAKKGLIRIEQIRNGRQIVERRIFIATPIEKPITPIRDPEGGYSEKGENPIRDPEGGYSENSEERGSVRGVQGEGSSKSVAPGASPADADDGGLLEKDQSEEPRIAIPADMPGPKDQGAKTFKPWANYAITYRRRYGVYPIWNAKVAGQLSQLVDRVGADLAPGVAAYYLGINSQYYVTKGHPVGLLLTDCETIATQLQTGQQMTSTRARQMDGTQANASAADEAKRLLDATWGE